MSINQAYEIQALTDKVGHFIRIRSLNKAKQKAIVVGMTTALWP